MRITRSFRHWAAVVAVALAAPAAVACYGFNIGAPCSTTVNCQTGNCQGTGWFPCGLQVQTYYHLVCYTPGFGYEACLDSSTTTPRASEESPTGYNCFRVRTCPLSNFPCTSNPDKSVCQGTNYGTWAYHQLPIEWLGEPCDG